MCALATCLLPAVLCPDSNGRIWAGQALAWKLHSLTERLHAAVECGVVAERQAMLCRITAPCQQQIVSCHQPCPSWKFRSHPRHCPGCARPCRVLWTDPRTPPAGMAVTWRSIVLGGRPLARTATGHIRGGSAPAPLRFTRAQPVAAGTSFNSSNGYTGGRNAFSPDLDDIFELEYTGSGSNISCVIKNMLPVAEPKIGTDDVDVCLAAN